MNEADAEFDGADRRAWPRYRPAHAIPVTFQHTREEGIAAGDIVDLSVGGMRIVAPPIVTVPLCWGEPVTVVLAYSEATRMSGVEGMTLESTVVEVLSNSKAYDLRLRFLRPLDEGVVARLAGIVTDPG